MADCLTNIRYRSNQETIQRDGYVVHKNVYIPMRDGMKLCANLYVPTGHDSSKPFPALFSLGPYGKDFHFAEYGKPKTDLYANMAKAIKPLGPDACFELVDPIVWCKEYGYVVVRVDSRGCGGSPGKFDPFGLFRSVEINDDSEGQDCYDAIEWIGTQDWSNGKVAMCGISYFGMACYWAAMQQPPHLTCIIAYEGATDIFTHTIRRGGIYSSGFLGHWYNNLGGPASYWVEQGNKLEDAPKPAYTDLETMWKYRTEGVWPILDRVRDLRKIKVPMMSAGNWTDAEVHLPGNINAFLNASSKVKFLEMHTGNHLAAYYNPEQIKRQRWFLDYNLKATSLPPEVANEAQIALIIRKGDKNFYRSEPSWPPFDVSYDTFFCGPDKKLSTVQPIAAAYPPKFLEYPGLTGSVNFETDPFSTDYEILGHPHFELELSTNAKDMDLFVYFYNINPQGEKVIIAGNHDEPCRSFNRGLIRLSQRSLAPTSEVHIPILSQNGPDPVEKDVWYKVKVAMPPTSMVFEPGHKFGVTFRAGDEEDTLPALQHFGKDRAPGLLEGMNRIRYNAKLVIPTVKRTYLI